ncbi:ABC transporter ATP-binding protein [Pontibacter liquoris]|uniref:ABC transporter ATP-binding protein n=1 Tax=Pontibacter liquoris TaxID=2905677 RepID=UPI001FA71A18|nr:polysaccharide ABC transporter ATP-binding protein [Pontibacter liquoris]
MANTVIKVENLSKQYRLGEVGTGTLTHDLNRWWHQVRGKEDPYLKIGEENNRSIKGSSDYVWALKDINFEVKQGEVVGVIGKNGAGKSTLLKILSRTTGATTGCIKLKGRISSLLEVGTGFHPELSGRDNVYLNGAILGMNKSEIQRKFDEIVDFSGVERYLDTPVKRYSSGMYVRLAFAVAAHLDPDILIIDEVLAVGDVEFQKKCLGKMKDVSTKDGKTILFVSHNLTAVKNICGSSIFMHQGRIELQGDTEEVVRHYLSYNTSPQTKQFFSDEKFAPGNEFIRIRRVEAVSPVLREGEAFTVHTPINIDIEFWNYIEGREINVSLHFDTMNYECVFNVGTKAQQLRKGLYKATCQIPGDFLNDGMFTIRVLFVADRSVMLYKHLDAINLEIHEDRKESDWHGKWPGYVRPMLNFPIATIS